MGRAGRIALVLCVAGVAWLALHTLQQQARIEQLERRLGQPASASPKGADSKPEQGLAPRLAAVERELRSLRDDLRTLEQATETSLAPPAPLGRGDAKEILSVVKGEQDRVRDRLLDFNRSRWLRDRNAAVDYFSAQLKLDPDQTSQLRELVEAETDRLIAIMRRPNALDDPEQAAADWRAVLRDTDRAVHGVLDQHQIAPWDNSRAAERRVLWPWLPED
jgi:hypothetical protein